MSLVTNERSLFTLGLAKGMIESEIEQCDDSEQPFLKAQLGKMIGYVHLCILEVLDLTTDAQFLPGAINDKIQIIKNFSSKLSGAEKKVWSIIQNCLNKIRQDYKDCLLIT